MKKYDWIRTYNSVGELKGYVKADDIEYIENESKIINGVDYVMAFTRQQIHYIKYKRAQEIIGLAKED